MLNLCYSGGFTWTGTLLGPTDECPLTPPPSITASSEFGLYEEESSIRDSAHQFTLALESLKQVRNKDSSFRIQKTLRAMFRLEKKK